MCLLQSVTPDLQNAAPSLHLQNNKDYFDQSLDEIKLLKFVNAYDPDDKYNLVRLYDYFYFKVWYSISATGHLRLVCHVVC